MRHAVRSRPVCWFPAAPGISCPRARSCKPSKGTAVGSWRGGVGRRRARPVVVRGRHAAPVGPGERRKPGARRAQRPGHGAVVLADGARALSWSGDRHAAPVGPGERRRAGRSKGTATGVNGAVVLADGARALSWSADGTLRLWDLASGAEPGARRAQRPGQWRGGAGRRRARPVRWGLPAGTTRCGCGTSASGAEPGARRATAARSLARWCWRTARAPCPGLRTGRCAVGPGERRKPGARRAQRLVRGAVVLADGARALSWSAGRHAAPVGPGERRKPGARRPQRRGLGAVVLADGARALSWSCGQHAAPVGPGERQPAGRSKGTATGQWRGGVGRRRARPVLVSGPHAAPVGSGERRKPGARRPQRLGLGAVVLADGARALSGQHGPHAAPVGSGERRQPGARRPQRQGQWRGGVGRRRARPVVVTRTARCACGTWRAARAGCSKATAAGSTGAVVLADGARALSWSADRTLRLWDLASGASRVLEGHSDRVSGAVVLADGARALSWSGDHTLRLWDLASGASRALEGHSAGVSGAVVLADGARALSWSGTARCACGTWRAAPAGRSKATAPRSLVRWCWRTARAPCPGRGPTRTTCAAVGPGERRQPGARRAQRPGHWCGAVGRRRARPVLGGD